MSDLLAGLCHICKGKRKEKQSTLQGSTCCTMKTLTLLEHLLFIFVIGVA